MRASILLAALSLAIAGSRPCVAQLAPGEAEANARFLKGVELYKAGDPAAALAEFRRAYELGRKPEILFNLAVVYAELKRPVEALDALDALFGTPAQLTPEQRLDAEELRKRQAALVGALTVTTSVAAAIEVDGVTVARTPLASPLRVASGTHVVGAVAPGHAPQRLSVEVAGGETRPLRLDLVPERIAERPAPAVSARDEHRHDGFFLRAQFGGGFLHATGQGELSGFVGTLSLAAGASVTDRVVVFAELYDALGSDPTVGQGGSTMVEKGSLAVLGAGAGAALFFMPTNLWLSGTLGFERLQQRAADGAALRLSTWTPALTASFGKEWWVTRSWALGGVAQLHASVPLGGADAYQTLWGALALSGTFN